jgi:hypothetical protein
LAKFIVLGIFEVGYQDFVLGFVVFGKRLFGLLVEVQEQFDVNLYHQVSAVLEYAKVVGHFDYLC